MNTYVNGFQTAKSSNGEEFILRFTQQSPSFNSAGITEDIEETVVAALVMTPALAKDIVMVLGRIISEEASTSEE